MTRVLIKRGPSENRENFIPISGELILDTTNMQLYVGDGETPGGIKIKNGCEEIASKIYNDGLELRRSHENTKLIIDGWEDLI